MTRQPLSLAALLGIGLLLAVPAFGQSCDRPPPPEKPTTQAPVDPAEPQPV